jgi:hypothetical protein
MFDNMDIGQFYAVTLDNRDPYYVYGGLQDNGNWGGPSNSRDWNGILNDHWFKFHSGDGFHTTVDPDDWRTVYTEAQGGAISRFDAVFRQKGKSIAPTPRTVLNFKDVVPDFKGSETRLPPSFRFNWSAALTLSPHESRIVYFGGNHLFKSVDRGETWTIISPDLSTNDPVKTNPESGGLTRDVTSAETHGAIITISESSLARGVIWAAPTMAMQLTRNGGASWANVLGRTAGGAERCGSARQLVAHSTRRRPIVRVRWSPGDDFRPWVFRTADYESTWTKLSAICRRPDRVNRDHRGFQNPEPALRRHRGRRVHVSVDGGSGGAHGRSCHGAVHASSSTRGRRSRGGHARPEHLGTRRHHAAPAAHAGRRGVRRAPVHQPGGDDLARREPRRHPRAPAVHGAQPAYDRPAAGNCRPAGQLAPPCYLKDAGKVSIGSGRRGATHTASVDAHAGISHCWPASIRPRRRKGRRRRR